MKNWKTRLITVSLLFSAFLVLSCSTGILNVWTGGKVKNLVVSQGTHANKITLSWDEMEGAAMYVLYAAQSENGDYQQVCFGLPTNTLEIFLGDDDYYYYDLVLGVHYWFRVHAIVSTVNGNVYSEMSDAVEGWSDENFFAGTWIFQSESIINTGGTEEIDSGERHELSINAETKTLVYKESAYNTGTSSYEVIKGAEYTYQSVLYPNDYYATVYLVDLRQKKYYSTGPASFVNLTTSEYLDITGGVQTGLEIIIETGTDYAVLSLSDDLYYDSNNDGSGDSYSYSGEFHKDL